MWRYIFLRYTTSAAIAFVVGGSPLAFGSDIPAGVDSTRPAQKPVETQASKGVVVTITDSIRATLPAAHQVIVYYFHGNVRCASCRKIEAYTKEAIDSAFALELDSGRMAWRVVNTDSSQYEHFLKDYQLYTRSVVVSDSHSGKETRWKNLEKVWELLGDQPKFHAYIRTELRPFLDPTK